MDFVNKEKIKFNSLKFLVLDEADRMLEMGFKEAINTILEHNTLNKNSVQKLLFSATFPSDIQRLAATYLRDYIFLQIGIVGGASNDVVQEVIEVTHKEKRKKLGVSLRFHFLLFLNIKTASNSRKFLVRRIRRKIVFLFLSNQRKLPIS